MDADSTRGGSRAADSPLDRAVSWLFVSGGRLLVAAIIVGVLVVAIAVAIDGGGLAVGPDSSVPQVFGSGLVAGLLTLVTVALSVNQLILSRVFASPDELRNHLEGSQDLRGTVAERAGRPVSPTSPAEFLSVVGSALADHANAVASDADVLPADLREDVEEIANYGDYVAENVDADTSVIDALTLVSGSAYAEYMAVVTHVDREYGDRLSEEPADALSAASDLLEAVAISRQFFKTMSLQQSLANLSRIVAFTGLSAIVVAVSVALVYRSGSVTVPRAQLPGLVTLAAGVVLTPLAVFVSFILRASTVARYTVSVGPFVPPEERSR